MEKKTKKYLLNSAVITSPGTYSYMLINAELFKEYLNRYKWESTIGYEETAIAIEKITGIKIPVNRKQIRMNVGDVALVFRLTKRVINPENKGNVSVETILSNCEIGILKKI